MFRVPLLLAAMAAVATAAPTAAAQPGRGSRASCFYIGDVTGYAPGGPGAVHAALADGRVARLETLNHCRQAQTADSLAIRAPASPRICRPVDVEVLAGRSRCPVRSVRILSLAETAALPSRQRP